MLVVGRHLRPDRNEAAGVGIGGLHQLRVGVIIEDGDELILFRLGEDPVDAIEKFGVDDVRRARAGVVDPIDRDANGVEAGLANGGKIISFQFHAPIAFVRRLERVAQIDAALDRRIRVGGGAMEGCAQQKQERGPPSRASR